MNPHAPHASSAPHAFAPGPLLLAAMIFVAALTRLLPHPPNFSPVAALALFGGAYFAARHWSFIVPLAALLVSDLALAAINGGSYTSYFGGSSMLLVYACTALTTLLGFGLRGKVGGARVLGYSLLGTAVFFLVTNFGVWVADAIYPKTLAGLGACYLAAIPFLRWSVLGTLFYGALLFGGFALLRQWAPSLRAQTV